MLKIAKAHKGFSLQIEDIASDKSLSHRAVMLSLLCDKPCNVDNFLQGEDTLHTLSIAKNLGLKVEHINKTLRLTPPKKIQEPSSVLDCGNAGTGMRLYIGLLSTQSGHFVLSGDKYLNARPMARVIKPLLEVGADILGRDNNTFAPISIRGKNISSFDYTSSISSAQVKSAMILAGLNANGQSVFTEPLISRDHTEKMLKSLGADIKVTSKSDAYSVSITPLSKKLESFNLSIPSDPSSAFFFAVAVYVLGACGIESSVLLKNVLLNPTRIEAFKVLEQMGAKIKYTITSQDIESIGDIEVCNSSLKAITLEHNISWLIDEIPALAVAMSIAQGRSYIKNAKELRVKESDRIASTIEGLRAFGVRCEELEDGMLIDGGELKAPNKEIDSYGDHRIAMSFAIASLGVGAEIGDDKCIAVSFPNFTKILSQITKIEER